MVIALVDRGGDDRLPVYLTRFFGREAELEQLAQVLADPMERVVTLVGPGGVGKTRLLVEAVERSRIVQPGDLVFVDGAALDRSDLLLPELVELLGIDPAGDRSHGELLSEFLAGRTLCLLLDNMEHLVPAAPDIAALVRALPGLRVLATSRSPLHISGERIVPVEPLGTTSTGSADRTLSVAGKLFVDRATRAARQEISTDLEFATVEVICARLEGLPLAIELAAARVRVLSLPALLAVLTNQLAVLTGGPVDVSERHRTLRAAIAWSSDLLDADEQRLFRELGIFVESFSLEAVQAICTPTREPLIDALESLFDQAMLMRAEDGRNGQPRFRMLHSIRDFAIEQLRESGEADEVRARHARWFLQLAESVEPQLTGPRQQETIGLLARAAPNLRHALDFMLEQHDQASALRMVSALCRFWLIRAQWTEARAAFDAAFGLGEPAPSQVWGAALRGAAIIAESQSDWAAALAWNRRAIEVSEALGDTAGIARSRIDLGNVYNCTGQYDDAIAEFKRAAAISSPETDLRNHLVATGSIGVAYLRQGQVDEADRIFTMLIPDLRRLDDPWLLATCLSNHGVARQNRGLVADARELLLESLQIRRELGDEYGVASGLINLGEVQDDPAAREAMSREAMKIGLRIGAIDVVSAARVDLGMAALGRDDRASAATAYLEALEGYSSVGDEVRMADVFGLIAELIEQSDAKRAVRLRGAARAIQTTHGVEPSGPIADRAAALDQRLRRRLGVPTFEAEWVLGVETDASDARIEAVQAARMGGVPGQRTSNRRTSAESVNGGLTARELDVLKLIAGGHTDREIAEELFISPKTANHHVTRILAKLECHNRAAATAMAFQYGLVS